MVAAMFEVPIAGDQTMLQVIERFIGNYVKSNFAGDERFRQTFDSLTYSLD
jgi:hypothetical protein